MRTTLDIDDDVLLALKDAAARERVSVGRMVSKLVRAALTPASGKSRNGVLVFEVKPDAPLMSMEMVNRLRDEE
ncbi:MAG: CopG family transcriptional regulator [Acidobacteria bacterium]|nr:CopG family transcriptional regulator [Acidobacteriota bacterium]